MTAEQQAYQDGYAEGLADADAEHSRWVSELAEVYTADSRARVWMHLSAEGLRVDDAVLDGATVATTKKVLNDWLEEHA